MVDCKENYKLVTGLNARKPKHTTNNGACQTSFFLIFYLGKGVGRGG